MAAHTVLNSTHESQDPIFGLLSTDYPNIPMYRRKKLTPAVTFSYLNYSLLVKKIKKIKINSLIALCFLPTAMLTEESVPWVVFSKHLGE